MPNLRRYWVLWQRLADDGTTSHVTLFKGLARTPRQALLAVLRERPFLPLNYLRVTPLTHHRAGKNEALMGDVAIRRGFAHPEVREATAEARARGKAAKRAAKAAQHEALRRKRLERYGHWLATPNTIAPAGLR